MATQLENSVDRFIGNEARVDTFVNGDKTQSYTTNNGQPDVPSIAKFLWQQAEAGMFMPFEKETILLTTVPNASKVVAKALDTGHVFIWENSTWTNVGLDDLTRSKQYADQLLAGNEDKLSAILVGLNVITSELSQYANLKAVTEAFLNRFPEEQLNQLLAIETLIGSIATLQNNSASSIKEPTFGNNLYVASKPTGLIELHYETTELPLPTAKGTVLKGRLKINVDGQIIDLYSTLEVQGSGSAAYPKKNWTLGLFSDSDFTKEVSVSIGSLLPQQEWVYKANYTDKAQVRNLMCYNLWGEFLKRRKGDFPVYEIDYSYVNSTGDMYNTEGLSYPSGFNCIININGDFYGIGQLMTGKKKENFNIAKNSPKQILIGLDNIAGFRMDTLPPGTFELRFPSKPTSVTNQCMDDWRNFATSDQATFNSNKAKFLDSRNVSDFYIYSQFIGNIDGVINNTNLGTWDGRKWLFIPYDMDLTFKDFRMNADSSDIFTYEGLNTDFWNKIRTSYMSELTARYSELRPTILNVTNMRNMYLAISNQFTSGLHKAELEKWPNRETTSPNGGGEISTYNIEQFCKWVARRIAYLDKMFNYK